MSPRTSLLLAGGFASIGAVVFALLTRLPLPFDGFAALVASGLAFLGTLALTAWMPASWLWTERERLTLAFGDRHGISGGSASVALEAIASAHERATALRQASQVMRDDMAEKVGGLADRMDAAAREIFYVPDRVRDLRSVLVRSELIEDAARAHAALRKRGHKDTEDASRAKLHAALDALDAAFDQTDLLAARGLLQEVEVASEVAETLLKPRRLT